MTPNRTSMLVIKQLFGTGIVMFSVLFFHENWHCFCRTVECGEACKTKKADLEKELRVVRQELKVKEELANEYEEELRQLRQYKESNDLQVFTKRICIKTCKKYLRKGLLLQNSQS